MPRLSLWKPEKGNDYKFVDRIIGEHIYAGGTGVFIHKYIGVYDQGETINPDGTVQKADATQPNYAKKKASDPKNIVAETKIQDLFAKVLLEHMERSILSKLLLTVPIWLVELLQKKEDKFI